MQIANAQHAMLDSQFQMELVLLAMSLVVLLILQVIFDYII